MWRGMCGKEKPRRTGQDLFMGEVDGLNIGAKQSFHIRNVLRSQAGEHGVYGGEIVLFFCTEQDVIGRHMERPAELDEGFRCEAAGAVFDGVEEGIGKVGLLCQSLTGISQSLPAFPHTPANLNV